MGSTFYFFGFDEDPVPDPALLMIRTRMMIQIPNATETENIERKILVK